MVTVFRILLAGLMLPWAVQAAELTDTYKACIEKGQTNREWADCGGSELKLQDRFLNEAWARVKKQFGGPDYVQALKALRAEQVAWLKWRDTTCNYYLADFGREGAVLSYPSCRAGIIAERTSYLNQLADNMEEHHRY